MKPSDDGSIDMDLDGHADHLDDAAVERLLSGRAVPGHTDLQEVVRLLRGEGDETVPPPSSPLAILLAAGLPPRSAVAPVLAGPAPGHRRWRNGVAALLAGAVALTGGAVANALPGPVQSAVADAVEAVTPFGLPRPTSPEPGGARSGGPAGSTSPDAASTPTPASQDPQGAGGTAAVTGGPEAEAGPGVGRDGPASAPPPGAATDVGEEREPAPGAPTANVAPDDARPTQRQPDEPDEREPVDGPEGTDEPDAADGPRPAAEEPAPAVGPERADESHVGDAVDDRDAGADKDAASDDADDDDADDDDADDDDADDDDADDDDEEPAGTRDEEAVVDDG